MLSKNFCFLLEKLLSYLLESYVKPPTNTLVPSTGLDIFRHVIVGGENRREAGIGEDDLLGVATGDQHNAAAKGDVPPVRVLERCHVQLPPVRKPWCLNFNTFEKLRKYLS